MEEGGGEGGGRRDAKKGEERREEAEPNWFLNFDLEMITPSCLRSKIFIQAECTIFLLPLKLISDFKES